MVSEWGLCQMVSLPPWQLPWEFGGDGLTPSGATLGIFAHNSRFWHKKRDLAHFTHWCIAPHSWMVSEWGLCLKVPPLPGQLPWEFGGDGPTPLIATPGVFTQKWDLAQKNGIWHILLTPDHLIFNSEAINIFPMKQMLPSLKTLTN